VARLGSDHPSLQTQQLQSALVALIDRGIENDAFFCANKGLDGFYFAGHWNLPSLETLQKEFKIKRLALERAEWAAQTSLLGPNRDDWVLLLGQQPLKVKGSQGEVRSTLMALKLCEIELFYDRTKLKPVFLLDDFSSELDRVRRKFLLNFILETDLQVFVTSTERMESFGRYFQIQSGALSLSSSSPETGLRAE
jgi:recombinational DNA repair ATPase RecF